MRKKRGAVYLMLLLTAVLSSACQDMGSPDQESKTSDVSSSPTFGIDSHVFEGEGGIDPVETESVELFGRYTVTWEVSDNQTESGDENGFFSGALEGESTHSFVGEDVKNGSGESKIVISKAGKYRASVISQPDAKWKITLSRTCAVVEPCS